MYLLAVLIVRFCTAKRKKKDFYVNVMLRLHATGYHALCHTLIAFTTVYIYLTPEQALFSEDAHPLFSLS